MDKALTELLGQLVAVPSINPSLSEDPSLGGENRLAKVLEIHLERLGFKTEWHEQTPGRANVVGRFGPAQPRRTILLESHLDTQGIHGMTVPPFDGIVEQGRLYGRGACDTKGPMAAALFALKPAVLQRLATAGCQVIYVGAMGEEKGNLGAEQLVDLGVGADEAIVLEPTDLNIVHAHKGAFWFEVEVRGVAAHGSNPSLGRNAIEGMVHVMKALDAERTRLEMHQNAVLGKPTLNVGLIRGGSSINIVPDRCVIEVDSRTVPGVRNGDILKRVRSDLDGLKAAGVLKDFSITPIKDGDPFETTADSGLVKRLLAACQDHQVTSQALGAAWYSDAGPFSRTCKDIAVFGPGSIRQAHTVDEYIELDNLETGARILETFLLKLADEVAARS